jgi:hypothetical protein
MLRFAFEKRMRLSVERTLVFAGARTLISKAFIVAKAVAIAFGTDARSCRLALRVACEAAICSAFII